ncbi:zinc-dependent metalloprotease [Yinghuangia soli]|uniref:Zinc-dependent metalloprotease n=1 Tax=Yinghuangia soli TaxID=2908204 RepID=A0AA41Q0M1_9ACTN|nr:zinc-dependent metalloprotease [Yinghuangia soli]MCF2529308.1 zinc-dependent metalloprotease [Yinghuangia soli]
MTSGADMIDWDLAVSTANRLVRPGPEVTRDEARAVVAELRAHAAESEGHVRAFTGLDTRGNDTPVLIVDRAGWVRANVQGFRHVLRPLLDKVNERRENIPGGNALTGMGSKVTGLELGTLLSFLSARVLGQYETFAPAALPDNPDIPATAEGAEDGLGGKRLSAGPGRLLLVAPNIVQVERELDVAPRDFRLWVCLHEETHRTQFTAVPWLRDHLEQEVHAFLTETEVDPAAMARRFRDAAQALVAGRRGDADEESRGGDGSLVELVQTPVQREILSRITAVMSLLEGHADYVMDGVGPQVIPSVGEIREKFQQRRARGTGRLDLALRKLLGMDAKLRQYKDGERFVRMVVDQVGMDGFNRVWTSPNTLPTRGEIADPQTWVDRVHSTRSAPE